MIDWVRSKLGVTRATVVIPALAKDRTGEVWQLDFRVGAPMVIVVGPPNCDEIKCHGERGTAYHPIVDLSSGRRDSLPEWSSAWERGSMAMRRIM